MLTQTWAIFYDSYRELNAKKLFWIVLILSGLVVVACAVPYVNEKGFWLLWWHISNTPNSRSLPRAELYKELFVVGIDYWLTAIGSLLSLISVASIFPDFITGGAIDLVLSKPIGRPRLFLTKYAAGLLFVTLQVTIFTVTSFLVLGLRGLVWLPGIFLAIPLVVLFFSYIYGICVFLGVMTRSTNAALLLTLLFWTFLWTLNFVDARMTDGRAKLMASIEIAERKERSGMTATQGFAATQPQGFAGPSPWNLNDQRDVLRTLTKVHQWLLRVKTVLPKTADTINLLSRTLTRAADLPPGNDANSSGGAPTEMPFAMFNEEEVRLTVKYQGELTDSRSLAWVIGTSLLFEAAVVGLAAWVFCRRDY